MQRTTSLLRTAAPLRTLTTSAARQQLLRPVTVAGPVRSRAAGWSLRALQQQQWTTRSLVNDAGAFKKNKDVTYEEIAPLAKQPTDVS